MKRVLCQVFVCVALTGAMLAGQEKPSFVGTWKLSADATPDMFTSPQVTVAEEGKTMTVTNASQMGEFKTTYSLDGTETKSPIDFNGTTIERVTKTAWDGSKLLLDHHLELQWTVFRDQGCLVLERGRDADSRSHSARLSGRRCADHHEGHLQEGLTLVRACPSVDLGVHAHRRRTPIAAAPVDRPARRIGFQLPITRLRAAPRTSYVGLSMMICMY